MLKRLHGTLAAAADLGPKDFADLLLTPGIGARTIEALAFVAEVVHGAPSRFSDPARFSLAHAGKDGHPFPVPIKVLDQTIRLLKSAVGRAKLGGAAGAAGPAGAVSAVSASVAHSAQLPRMMNFFGPTPIASPRTALRLGILPQGADSNRGSGPCRRKALL
jgi:hypothetical protein